MLLHTYETTCLQAGWTCTYCAAELAEGLDHYVNPAQPDGAFCRQQCAEDHAEREARKATSALAQIGLAL